MTIENRKRALDSFNFASIYFSFLLQRDDISIVMGYPPTFDRSPGGAVSINILLDQEITFIIRKSICRLHLLCRHGKGSGKGSAGSL
jgi:hypothetical protein